MIGRESNTAKILVADDDLDILELLQFTLKSERYKVITATDGEQALQKIKEEFPDLVILDVNMPKLNGYEVCEKVRENSSTHLIPIIMLTSLTKTKDRLTGIKLGADEYLSKPFEPFELVAHVEGLLRRSKESLSANPLTGLPGNISIETEIRRRLESGHPFAVIYADVDHFKAFNDKYGFERGDNVIRLVASLLRNTVAALGNESDFVGNIGGEDFIVLTTQDKAGLMAEKIVKDFDGSIPDQYDADVRARGYFWGVNRQGQEVQFPLMTISAGIAMVEKGLYCHYSQVVERTKELLKTAKTVGKSNFVVG